MSQPYSMFVAGDIIQTILGAFFWDTLYFCPALGVNFHTFGQPLVSALQKDRLRPKAGLKYKNLDPGQDRSIKFI